MAEAWVSNPLVTQFRRGRIPRDLRLMAAQGDLPLKPNEVVDLLHHLLGDEDEDIRKTAAKSLVNFPVDQLLPILSDRNTPPTILAWTLTRRDERELREVSLQNPSTPDEAIEALAGALVAELAELVVINQVRLLRRTSLLEALEGNPNLNKDQRRRLRELRESFRIGGQGAIRDAAPVVVAAPTPVAEDEDEGLVEPTMLEDEPASEDEAVVRYLSEDERRQAEKISAVQRLYRLNTAQKVITALKGSREERAILVRDPNRIVASAVLGSPRMTESEVEAFASMKNLSSEVLRQIGTHKEWTKRYSVIANLVRNPRTPIGISLGMVARLNPRDIKGLAVDRNIPEVIRKQAQRFVKTAGDGKKN